MRKLVYIGLTGLLLCMIQINVWGQVNTEKFRRYADQEGYIFNTKLLLGYSDGNSKYISVDGTLRLDYNGKKNNAFIVGNYEFKETDASKVVNKGFIHLRGVRPFHETLALEGFLQQEFNEFLYLNDRKLVGASLRTRLINWQSPKDSISTFSSYLGLGLMYEYEIYDVQEGENLTVIQNTLRTSTYLTLDLNLSNRINCWAVGYFQPNIQAMHDFRAVLETGVEIWVIGRLYFTVDFSYRYNNQPVGDASNYDLVFKNGLRYSIQ